MAEEELDKKPFPNGPPTLLYQGRLPQPVTLLTAAQPPVNSTLRSVSLNGLPMFISVPTMAYNATAPVLGNILQAPAHVAASIHPPLHPGTTPRYETLKRTLENQDEDSEDEEIKSPSSSPSPKAMKPSIQHETVLRPVLKPASKTQIARQRFLLDELPRRQRAQISAEMRGQIVKFRRDHPLLRQVEIADIFGIDRSTVTKMLKRCSDQQKPSNNDETLGAQYELEDVLYRWLGSHRLLNRLTDQQLLQQAHDLHESCNIQRFTPNIQWLQDFKARFRLKAKEPPGRKSATGQLGGSGRKNIGQDTGRGSDAALDHSMKLSRTPEEKSFPHPTPSGSRSEPATGRDVSNTNTQDTPPITEDLERIIKVEELDDQQALNRDMKSLEKFREQQKAIEEANKQKKAMLAKTLTERKKKAQAEAYKLEHVQKELSKLDHLLTADVQVIRDKIEGSSREFMDAQRRFEKAEKEYVAAKMDLHQKSELKEQLTEHLYTIIHQNEVRKSQKLAEIMKELDMDNSNDEFLLPELPPLSSFHPPTMPVSPTGVLSPTRIHPNPVSVPDIKSEAGKSVDESGVSNTNGGNGVQSETTSSENSSNDLAECDRVNKADSERTSSPIIIVVKQEPIDESEMPGSPRTEESIKIGQTSRLLNEMKANVDKELETVTVLMENTNKTQSKEITEERPTVPSKWDFDGTLK